MKGNTKELVASAKEVFGRTIGADIESLVELTSGVVNPLFLVNESWVVRFNQRDKDIPKF